MSGLLNRKLASSILRGLVTTFVPAELASVKIIPNPGADYIVLDTDGYSTILVTTVNSDRTITLPTAADNTGRTLRIAKVDNGSGDVIVDGEGAETINGAATYVMPNQYDEVTLTCSGTAWFVVSKVRIPDTTLILNTGNGSGSTNVRVRRFTNIQTSAGSGLTYSDSATLGASITVAEPGIYSMSWSDERTASGGPFTWGFSVNGSGTTAISSLAAANVLQLVSADATSNAYPNVSVTAFLLAGDVIRPHHDGNMDSTSNKVRFVITQVARI